MDKSVSLYKKKETTLFSDVSDVQLKDFQETFYIGKEEQIKIQGHQFYNSQNKNKDYTAYYIKGELIFLAIEKELRSQEEIDAIINYLEEEPKTIVLFRNYNNVIMSLYAYEKIIKKGCEFYLCAK